VRPDHLLPPIPGRVGFEARLGPAYRHHHFMRGFGWVLGCFQWMTFELFEKLEPGEVGHAAARFFGPTRIRDKGGRRIF